MKEWGIEVSGWKSLDLWTLAKARIENFIRGHGRIALCRVVCSGFPGTQGAGLQEEWKLRLDVSGLFNKNDLSAFCSQTHLFSFLTEIQLSQTLPCNIDGLLLVPLSHSVGYFMGTLISLVILESHFCVPQLQADT